MVALGVGGGGDAAVNAAVNTTEASKSDDTHIDLFAVFMVGAALVVVLACLGLCCCHAQNKKATGSVDITANTSVYGYDASGEPSNVDVMELEARPTGAAGSAAATHPHTVSRMAATKAGKARWDKDAPDLGTLDYKTGRPDANVDVDPMFDMRPSAPQQAASEESDLDLVFNGGHGGQRGATLGLGRDARARAGGAEPGGASSGRNKELKHSDSLLLQQSMAIKPNVREWSCSEVLTWIAMLGLPINKAEVREAGLDGATLLDLDDADLLELKVAALQDRRHIMQEIRELRQSTQDDVAGAGIPAINMAPLTRHSGASTRTRSRDLHLVRLRTETGTTGNDDANLENNVEIDC